VTARALRPILIALLLIGTAGAAYLGVALERTTDALLASQLEVEAGIAGMTRAAAEIGAAQEAYVAPGQPDQPWLQRVSELMQQVSDASTAIRPRLRSTEAADRLQTLAGNIDSLLTIDGRIRVMLNNGQDLSASDLIFTDARDTVTAIADTLGALAQNERDAFAAERAGLAQQGWMLLATLGAMWAIGLLILARRQTPADALSALPPVRVDDSMRLPQEIAAIDLEAPQPPPPAPAVDLDAAAAICTHISRLTTTAALPGVLAEAAAVLDASGLILWMGAGEELFAVTAHGYDPKVLARLGPIGRHANNATAAAWRTGALGVVSGDMMSNGAIVAPMFGVDSCIGVLAAELRHGREADRATAAVAAMFAAQLATIVAAWPGPSEAATGRHDSGDPLAASL
jgi:hypothetical protein